MVIAGELKTRGSALPHMLQVENLVAACFFAVMVTAMPTAVVPSVIACRHA
jgi:hypothetical protein